jgi:prepilin-type processing-associated H-X9-DG protein
VTTPTLLVTRYEYANIFHTLTDWYNAYQARRMFGLTGTVDVVFLDGHAKGTGGHAKSRRSCFLMITRKIKGRPRERCLCVGVLTVPLCGCVEFVEQIVR